MASECIYYQWKYGYYCNLANKEIDDDTVHRFCWTYNSDDCPLRKNQRNDSDGCYLTSACVRAKNLPDNCEELEILRAFRDGYLKSRDDGLKDVELYYLKAPKLVAKINDCKEPKTVYNRIYEEMILPCIQMIKEDKLDQAYQCYKEYSTALMQQFDVE